MPLYMWLFYVKVFSWKRDRHLIIILDMKPIGICKNSGHRYLLKHNLLLWYHVCTLISSSIITYKLTYLLYAEQIQIDMHEEWNFEHIHWNLCSWGSVPCQTWWNHLDMCLFPVFLVAFSHANSCFIVNYYSCRLTF